MVQQVSDGKKQSSIRFIRKFIGRSSIIGAMALHLALETTPASAENSSGKCLTSEEILNTEDLTSATACEAHGALFIAFNTTLGRPNVGFDHPFKDYESGLATFLSLRREIDIEQINDVELKHELQVSILFRLLQHSMETRPEDIAANTLKLQAIRDLIEMSFEPGVKEAATSIQGSYAAIDEIELPENIAAICLLLGKRTP